MSCAVALLLPASGSIWSVAVTVAELETVCPAPPGLTDAVRSRIAEGTRKVIIDLADTEKIDSCGIGILASVMWSASQAGGGMVLVSVPEQVEKLLGMVMLLDRIDHADS